MNRLYLFSIFLFVVLNSVVFGQFTITNTLRTNDTEGLMIGDGAYLTAATGKDVNGDGWMRLTEAVKLEKGYMYVQQSFPTTLGLTVDFEYVAWRDVYDDNFGADGFTMFLFDGSITDSEFKLGGYGGSLGYANFSNPPNTPGLTGGYLGIGFDAFGNYIRAVEGRNGGGTTYVPNSIVMRGPTKSVFSESNIYLAKAELGNRSGNINTIRQRNEIDYNTVVAKRPSPNTFYRRVQINITKQTNSYLIEIRWRKENETTFTKLISYNLDSTLYPLPDTLKLGFAGGTGWGFNYQEIRNVILTTPGNLRVDSRSTNSFVCNQKKSSTTFKVEVTNDTASPLNNIIYNTKIQDDKGITLDISKFKITGISLSGGFTNSSIPTSNFTTNDINGVIGLRANTSGIITITGEYNKGLKTNTHFEAVTKVETKQVSDEDTTNNTSVNNIFVRKCSVLSNPVLPTTY